MNWSHKMFLREDMTLGKRARFVVLKFIKYVFLKYNTFILNHKHLSIVLKQIRIF